MEIQKRIYVLNTLITPIDFSKTNEAVVKLQKISIEEAKQLLQNNHFISAIGHESTAKLLSQLLNIDISMNRTVIYFEKGDIGLHFFLKTRIPEGKVLSESELKQLDFWLVKSQIL